MITIGWDHDPKENEKLIKEVSGTADSLEAVWKETKDLFLKDLFTPASSEPKGIRKVLQKVSRIFQRSIQHQHAKVQEIFTDDRGDIYPYWKEQLDQEYKNLLNEIDKEVNLKDFGAIGDGVTDNTDAFKKAIGDGRVKVIIPEGVFITKGIRIPSWTILEGQGKGKTTIKLHNRAPKSRRLVTNLHYRKGNHHISIQKMSLDWNLERLNSVEKSSSGGNHSSCLTLANVTYGWVKEIEGINPGLHCFDISSPRYNYSGDGKRASRGSRYIWLDYITGYGFGDDGVTTHHSDNILITHSYMHDPSGRAHQKGHSNSNGFEIDDGSRNVWLLNNSSARCFGGVEIKAHHNSSASSNVQIIGHLSLNDNRSYNFRHIGHHHVNEPESKTAYNIMAANLVAIAPKYSDLYTESTPRGMVVSAYRNVAINRFTLIGDPDYDYTGNPILTVQYRSRNVKMRNVSIKDFKTAGADIKVFGGSNHADHVSFTNVSITNSSPIGVDIGTDIREASLNNVKAARYGGRYGIKAASSLKHVSSIYTEGYKVPISISGKTFKSIP